MIRYAKLYWLFLAQRFKILMEYRTNFFIGVISTVFLQAASILSIWIVMLNVPVLQGWTYEEILMVYGLLTLAKSLNHMFADNLWPFGWSYVRTGQFDRFLVRPIDPLFHLLADRFCHDGIGHFLVGLFLVIQSSIKLSISWTPLLFFYTAIMVISGGVIFMALNLITCVSAFWIIDSVPVTKVIFETNEFAKYPLNIYPNSIRILMTWVIPYGLASFYPASYILGRDIGVIAWAAPPVAAVLLFIGYRVWQFGMRHYASTGS
ncbi:MAG: ABC-2 family transporter protein [Anaerolineae bacterium]|nr:ABC-2 family transporter protein [Anaerolineae bacterium]